MAPTVSSELDAALRSLMQSAEGTPFVVPLAKRFQGMVALPLDLCAVQQRVATGRYSAAPSLLDGVALDVRQIWENVRNAFGDAGAAECKKALVCEERFEESLAAIAALFDLEVPSLPLSIGRPLPRSGMAPATVCYMCSDQDGAPIPFGKRTGLVFDEAMLRHRDMADKKFKHPEKPQRIARIFKELRKSGLVDRCVHVPSRRATTEELQAVHSEDLIEQIDGLASLNKLA